jgi:hypothetical protein
MVGGIVGEGLYKRGLCQTTVCQRIEYNQRQRRHGWGRFRLWWGLSKAHFEPAVAAAVGLDTLYYFLRQNLGSSWEVASKLLGTFSHLLPDSWYCKLSYGKKYYINIEEREWRKGEGVQYLTSIHHPQIGGAYFSAFKWAEPTLIAYTHHWLECGLRYQRCPSHDRQGRDREISSPNYFFFIFSFFTLTNRKLKLITVSWSIIILKPCPKWDLLFFRPALQN